MTELLSAQAHPPATGFVLELGENETIKIEPEPAEGEKTRKEWRSAGFYRWYEVKGPVIVQRVEDAFIFPSTEKAENVRNGDERLKMSRVVPVAMPPTEVSTMPPI